MLFAVDEFLYEYVGCSEANPELARRTFRAVLMVVGLIATGDLGERVMLIAATGDLREVLRDDGPPIFRESFGLATRVYILADIKVVGVISWSQRRGRSCKNFFKSS